MKKVNLYSIEEVVKISGISSRALRFYEEAGLLKPKGRTAGGRRSYGKSELLKLQQILFYKELALPLKEIAKIVNENNFAPIDALKQHRIELITKQEQLNKLIKTIDKTILHIKNHTPMKDEELYEGFTSEEIASMNKEVDEKYDPAIVAESRRRVKNMSHEQWAAVKAEAGAFTTELAKLMVDHPANSPEVQAQIKRHHAWIENFYDCSAEIYRGLGRLYTTDSRFRANYDKVKPGLADFMQKAMNIFADSSL